MKKDKTFHILPTPKGGKRLSTSEVLNGTIMPKIDRLRAMNDDDYEDSVLEWAFDFLKGTYVEVKLFGGAGDKGRDVVGFYDTGEIDIYQCKHYDSVIGPTTLYPELAKLCYYTFNSDYKVPKKYCIVSPHGAGPAVADYIKNPKTINAKLIENWKKYCENIATPKIELNDKLEEYIKDFDFSILCEKNPLEFIEEHGKTVYHAKRFGGLSRYRDIIPKASKRILGKELVYVSHLFEVYSEEIGTLITSYAELEKLDALLAENFNNQRNSFYSAESLERFSRENYPDADPLPFNELKEDVYSIVGNCLLLNKSDKGLEKLLKSIQEVLRSSFSSNPLSINNEIRPLDKQGICHHLVNDKKIKWI